MLAAYIFFPVLVEFFLPDLLSNGLLITSNVNVKTVFPHLPDILAITKLEHHVSALSGPTHSPPL